MVARPPPKGWLPVSSHPFTIFFLKKINNNIFLVLFIYIFNTFYWRLTGFVKIFNKI